MHVCHNDGDKDNNFLFNLRWDTRIGNASDKKKHGTFLFGETSPRSIFTNLQVLKIRELKKEGISNKKISAIYKCSEGAIRDIIVRKTWKHL